MDLLTPQVPGERIYCPVPCCPKHNSVTSAGWTSLQSLRPHLEEHLSGRLEGEIPQEWLHQRQLHQCQVCHKLIAARFGPSCPRCRPALQREVPPEPMARPIPETWPSAKEIHAAHIPTRKNVPAGAKMLWTQCLLGVLQQIQTYNDERAWLELALLPKCVLVAPPRAGTLHRRRNEQDTKDRCRRWLEGQRETLWSADRKKRRNADLEHTPPSLQDRMDRAQSLVEEGMLMKKACAALVDGHIAHVTPEVLQEMEAKHPQAREDDLNARKGLRVVSAAAVQPVTKEQIRKALVSFPKGSAPGPCGLKPQHLKDALTP
eukprot:6475844-Amphidinium_carterae.1